MLLDNSFPPDIRVESEAISLLNEGHQVSILCYKYGESAILAEYKGIRLIGISVSKAWSKKIIALMHVLPFYKDIWTKALKSELAKNDYDAIHIHDLPLSFLFSSMSIDQSVRKVIDLHENFPYLMEGQDFMKRFPWKYILSKKSWFDAEKKWLKFADKIICVDQNMKTRISQMVRDVNDVIVVPNTISVGSFVKSQIDNADVSNKMKNSYNLLYIGGIDSTRGLETLVEAADILKDIIEGLKVWIVGSGSGHEIIKNMIKERNLNDFIVMEGHMPQSSIGSYIQAADICIIPHLKTPHTDNTSANKLFQYMYYAKPIVSSNCAALERVIFDAACGLIFESGNSKQLAECVEKIYKSKELTVQFGLNAKKSVLEKYNWEATVKPMLDMYNNIG